MPEKYQYFELFCYFLLKKGKEKEKAYKRWLFGLHSTSHEKDVSANWYKLHDVRI